MSQYTGKFFLVKLPQHVTDLYNGDNPALAPVDVGTERPVLVVGETIGQSQDIDSGRTNPDGTHMQQSISLADTVNVLVFHDGDVKPRYFAGVPVEDLLDVGAPQAQEAPEPAPATPSSPEPPTRPEWS